MRFRTFDISGMKSSKSFFLKIQIFYHDVEKSSRSDALQDASELMQTMKDEFETVQVDRAPIGSLSLKRRSVGISFEETLRQISICKYLL